MLNHFTSFCLLIFAKIMSDELVKSKFLVIIELHWIQLYKYAFLCCMVVEGAFDTVMKDFNLGEKRRKNIVKVLNLGYKIKNKSEF